MKVASIEFGQATWLVDYQPRPGKIYLPEAINSITEKYGFVKSPAIEELLQPNFIPVFEHGKFRDSVIRRFSIYTDGLIAESAAGTEVAEEFLHDFSNFIEVEYGSKILGISQEFCAYDSHIVAQINIGMEHNMHFTSEITERLSSMMSAYSQPSYSYKSSGFILEADPTDMRTGSTSRFSIERRANQPFERNLYLCCAPLKTEDHVMFLGEIEKII